MFSSETKNEKTVIVLGMARSGTSVTSGILQRLGVDMGKSKGPDSSNPRGRYEDIDIAEVNRKIYRLPDDENTYWNPPEPEELQDYQDTIESILRQVIQKKRERNSESIWGWKAPWTNLTIKYFLPLIENPHFVLVFRNPMSVAHSTIEHTRDMLEEPLTKAEALEIINFYNAEIISFYKNHQNRYPFEFVEFENLIPSPTQISKRLGNFLGIEVTEKTLNEIKEFVIPRDKIDGEKEWLEKKEIYKKWFKFQGLKIQNLIENPDEFPDIIKREIINILSKFNDH